MAAVLTDPAVPSCVPPALAPSSKESTCTPQQMEWLLERSIAYWGTNSVVASRGVVVHHAGIRAGTVGRPRVRYAFFSPSTFTTTTVRVLSRGTPPATYVPAGLRRSLLEAYRRSCSGNGVGTDADYLASSIRLAVSAAAFFASAFSPTPISFTSTTTLRMVPVNFVLFGW